MKKSKFIPITRKLKPGSRAYLLSTGERVTIYALYPMKHRILYSLCLKGYPDSEADYLYKLSELGDKR